MPLYGTGMKEAVFKGSILISWLRRGELGNATKPMSWSFPGKYPEQDV